jgi:hypothetical protein
MTSAKLMASSMPGMLLASSVRNESCGTDRRYEPNEASSVQTGGKASSEERVLRCSA